jgi:hypothetical protein
MDIVGEEQHEKPTRGHGQASVGAEDRLKKVAACEAYDQTGLENLLKNSGMAK